MVADPDHVVAGQGGGGVLVQIVLESMLPLVASSLEDQSLHLDGHLVDLVGIVELPLPLGVKANLGLKLSRPGVGDPDFKLGQQFLVLPAPVAAGFLRDLD